MKKYYTLFVLSIFLIVNVVFNYSLWQKLWLSRTNQAVYSSDATITELLTETSYENLLDSKNLFTPTDKLFYPFGMDFALNDPGTSFVLPFILLRPMFSIYQSLLLSVLLFLYLASVTMYALLRYLKMSRWISLTFALVFAYMPFISHRLQGHYTYVSHFLFPLVLLLFHIFFSTSIRWKKFCVGFFIPLSLALTIYSNFYYFIMIILAIGFYSLWYCVKNFREFGQLILKNIFYFLAMIVLFLITLSPWLISVRDIIVFEGMETTTGYGGAVQYSADLLGWLIPNQFNYLYLSFVHVLGSISPTLSLFEQYFLHSWDRFVYPGAIILGIYGWLAIKLKKHELPDRLWSNIRIPFYASIGFATLSLGPFLKIGNIWHLNLDGVEVIFPLPFLLLRSLPGLSGLRAPMRLTPGFVFFACLVGAYVVTYLIQKLPKRKRLLGMCVLLIIFFVDQHYFIPTHTDAPAPVAIYNYIKSQPNDGTVMEIPLTVRDGFQYRGFVHALSPMQGEMIHGHPIVGGYFARVGQPIFDYYDKLPFVSYILHITDRGNYNPIYEHPNDPDIYPFNISLPMVQKELDFLNVGYIISKDDEPYSSVINSILSELGLVKIMNDNSYSLYARDIGLTQMDSVNFGDELASMYIGRGLSEGNAHSQVMIATRAQVFLSTHDPAKYKILHIKAASTGKTELKIFMNRKVIGTIALSETPQDYNLPVMDTLIPHVNSIMFIRSETSDPVSLSTVDLQ